MKEKELKHNFSAKYVEFPALLFGEVMGVEVFNASAFLKNTESKKSVDGFKIEKKELISVISTHMKMDVDQMFLVDAEDNVLVRGELALAFLSYVSMPFNIHCLSMMDDLLMNGFAISDRYLAIAAAQRLPKETLNILANQ